MPFWRTFYLRSMVVLKSLFWGLLFCVFSIVLLTVGTCLSVEKTLKGVPAHWRTDRTCRAEMAEQNVLRTCDGTQCSVLLVLDQGEEVLVTKHSGEWTRVYAREELGWVYWSFIKECEEE